MTEADWETASAGDIGINIPRRARLMRRYPQQSFAALERRSRRLGLAGLIVLSLVLASCLPFEVQMADRSFRSPSYAVTVAIMQCLIIPLAIVFGFMVVAFVFREGSLIKNLILGFVPAALTAGAFVGSRYMTNNISLDSRILVELAVLLIGAFAGVAFAAIFFRVWTRWRLTPLRFIEPRSHRAGIYTMLEIVTIFAALFAVTISFNTVDYVFIMCIVVVAGLLVGVSVICSMIAMLSKSSGRAANIATVAIATLISLAWSSFVAIDFGWSLTVNEIIRVVLMSLVGTIGMSLMMSICNLWLRNCGWMCWKLGASREDISVTEIVE